MKYGSSPVCILFVHAQVGVLLQVWRFDDAADQVFHCPARHDVAFEWRVAHAQFVFNFIFVCHRRRAHDDVAMLNA